jgi:undecaprenyl-phosphate galactose phosphotransferase
MNVTRDSIFGSVRQRFSPQRLSRSFFEYLALFMADFFAMIFAFWIWFDFRGFGKYAGTPPVLSAWMNDPAPSHLIAFGSAGALVLMWFWTNAHYSKRLPFWEELGQILKIVLTGCVTEIALLVLLSNARMNWGIVAATWMGAAIFLPFGRVGAKRILLLLGLWRRNAMVVGTGENARGAYAALRAEPLMGYDVRWFGRTQLDGECSTQMIEVQGERVPVVDLSHQPLAALAAQGNPQLVIAIDSLLGQEEMVLKLGAASTNILVIPSIRGLPLQGAEVSHFFSREVLMLRIKNNLAHRGARFVKRAFDIVGSIALLVLLSPAFLIISFLIRRGGGRAIYGHSRVGADGREFRCLKFRSMMVDADRVLQELFERDPGARIEWEKDFKLKDDPRITRIGAFLRRTSLDELPQLINVLKGDMSLVGPRPVVRDELQRYGEQVGYYLQVRPGMTGLWQVSGRNDVTYATRVGLDVWYVKNWSLWTDIIILLKTWPAVFGRMGAY